MILIYLSCLSLEVCRSNKASVVIAYIMPRSWFLKTISHQEKKARRDGDREGGKKTRILGKMGDSRSEQEQYKVNLEDCVVLKSSKCSTSNGVLSKPPRSDLNWTNLR